MSEETPEANVYRLEFEADGHVTKGSEVAEDEEKDQ